MVTRGDVPAEIRRNVEQWIGCVAGALREDEYISKLEQAGFTDVEVEPTRVYRMEDAREFLTEAGPNIAELAPLAEEKVISAFVRARKP